MDVRFVLPPIVPDFLEPERVHAQPPQAAGAIALEEGGIEGLAVGVAVAHAATLQLGRGLWNWAKKKGFFANSNKDREYFKLSNQALLSIWGKNKWVL